MRNSALLQAVMQVGFVKSAFTWLCNHNLSRLRLQWFNDGIARFSQD
jgi:hypothetical protein